MELAEHERRILFNLKNKPKVRELPKFVDVIMYMGGEFKDTNGVTEYSGGTVYTKYTAWLKELGVDYLRDEVESAMNIVYSGRIASNFRIWYKVKGAELKYIECSDDIQALIEGRDMYERVSIYVEQIGDGVKKGKGKALARPKVKAESVVVQPKALTIGKSPTRRSPRRLDYGPEVYILPSNHPDVKRFSSPPKSTKVTPTLKSKGKSTIKVKKAKSLPKPPNSSLISEQTQKTPPKTIQNHSPVSCSPLKKATPRRKQVARKNVSGKGRSKVKEKKAVQIDEDYVGEPGWSSDSDLSDLEVDFVPEEEDFIPKGGPKVGHDEFVNFTPRDVTKAVVDAFRKTKETGSVSRRKAEADAKIDDVQEVSYESDELNSLHGSDEEVDPYPYFNPKTDFFKKITLTKGLKFRDIQTLRKALRAHAIQKHYDYYYLHNGGGRVTTYCKHKCECPWDSKHGKIICSCEGEFKCEFRVHARKLKMEQTFQIKTLNLEHQCGYQDANPKVSSEYLCDRYLEYFRDNPGHSLRTFRKQVQIDLGVEIGYFKAWFARARAKFLLYGDGAMQYTRVYDYAFAVLKENPGSTCIVVCDGVESGSHIFQRIYMCLDACKKGFKRGCRPVIGVDGCHLKGEYPGMILAAVAKDGNNNIFPVAWSVVEVENKESWTWFLNLLLDDLEFIDGEGLTIMSDRQKGLLDAISVTASKAEVRFCVRHIWANFKLQFEGQAFKEHFWHAARTSNKHTWEVQMFIIKELDEDAYTYLSEIPEKHWARHAFQTHSKSNMLLNNLCETFNSVLKEARDKPIITCMDWIRRYVMKRNFEKLEGAKKHRGRLMPYISKVFEWVKHEAMSCALIQSSATEWEVELDIDKHVVNLEEWTCTCNKWQLTGIPCPHAYACITKRRDNPDKYVHDYYSKARYIQAYKENIKPMTGMEQWEKINMPHPLPPPIRKMPGRPSKKKRKRILGEDGNSKYVKRLKKQNCCSNCGQPGHNKISCKNAPAPPKPKNKGGRPTQVDPWSVNRRLKKEARVAAMQYPQASGVTNQSTQAQASHQAHHQACSQAQASTSTQADHCVIASQGSSATARHPKPKRAPKLAVKSTAKKQSKN